MVTKKTSGRTKGKPASDDVKEQVLLLILGSGPAVAAFDALLQTQAANGAMYQHAVENQQKTNILGMAMTAKAVRYMLDPDYVDQFDEEVEMKPKKKRKSRKKR